LVGESLDEIEKRSWLACLSTRYNVVLGDLADPKTTSLDMYLPDGSSREVFSSFSGMEGVIKFFRQRTCCDRSCAILDVVALLVCDLIRCQHTFW
jgi:hypothetical protein